MAGVYEDALLLEQSEGEIVVGAGGGNAKDDVPAGFNSEAGTDFLCGELRVEGGEAGTDAREKLRLELLACGEKCRQSVLDGRVHGEIGIGDDFEAARGVLFEFLRAGQSDPGAFHLRQAAELGDAAEGEGERRSLRGEGWRGWCLQGEVEEDFIGDESQVVFCAEGGELGLFVGLGVMAGGIVGMNEDGGAGARSDGAFEGREIELPAVIVDKRIADKFDVVEIGEEVKERVAGTGNEDFVAGIAEEAEEIRVGFAGAGGEEEIGWRDICSAGAVVGSHGFAGRDEALGNGFVAKGGGRLQRRENDGLVIGEAALGRIGDG